MVKKLFGSPSLVDGAKDGDYHPRTAAEMKQIEALVKSAIGFDGARGDLVQVSSMTFAKMDMPNATAAPAPFLGLDGSYWFKIIEVGILSLTALLIGFFVARPLIQRMFAPVSYAVAQAVPGMPAAGAIACAVVRVCIGRRTFERIAATAAGAARQYDRYLPHRRTGARTLSVRKVGEVVQAHPEEAMAILRTWLHQPV